MFVLQLSILLTVCSLGLQASLADATSLFRRPSLLFRSLLAMNFFMPLFAVSVAATFPLHPAVKIALVCLAVSPVPPILPRAQMKLGGSSHYVCGLLVSAALLSIILVPLTIELLSRIFGRDVRITPGAVAKIMATSVLLPLALGMLIRRFAPGLAQRTSLPLSAIAFLLLVASAAVLLTVSLPGIAALIGNGTVLAIAMFAVVGIAVGHWMGGPDPADRSVLALATASRHPGLALAIAGANFPGQRQTVIAALLLYLLVKAVVLIPYNSWQKHRQSVAGRQRAAEPKRHAA
jgi:BASS family bile acid:Na+ symporter